MTRSGDMVRAADGAAPEPAVTEAELARRGAQLAGGASGFVELAHAGAGVAEIAATLTGAAAIEAMDLAVRLLTAARAAANDAP